MAEQSEERVTLWRWRPGHEPGIDHARSLPGPQASPWQEMGHIPAAMKPAACEVAEFIRVSPSPVDTEGHGLSEGGEFAEAVENAGNRAADERIPEAPLAESDSTPERCPTCGSDDPVRTGGGYRLTQGGSCPDPWHSRSQAGEGTDSCPNPSPDPVLSKVAAERDHYKQRVGERDRLLLQAVAERESAEQRLEAVREWAEAVLGNDGEKEMWYLAQQVLFLLEQTDERKSEPFIPAVDTRDLVPDPYDDPPEDEHKGLM